MNGTMIVLIGIVVIAAVIWLAVLGAAHDRERLAGLAAWASANGYQFSINDPFNLDARFHGIGDIGQGHSRRAFEILSRSGPIPTWMFRYEFRTWETRTVTDSNGHTHTETYEETHHCSFLIVELQSAFPRLFLRPENLFDKVAAMVGFDDINFESEDFSRHFFCKSDNREFAYAVIHPQMMDWLLSLRAAKMRFEGQLAGPLFVSHIDKLPTDAPGRQAAITMAAGFINRIPPFVWQDYGKRPPVELPLPHDAPPPPPSIDNQPATAENRHT
jgi:hypothetical protein